MSNAALASLLPLPVAIPIVGAVLAPVLARISRRLPLVVSVELEATALYLPPPAGRRIRSLTLLPALPDEIRHATIVPFTGAA